MNLQAFNLGDRVLYLNRERQGHVYVVLDKTPIPGVFKVLDVSTKDSFFAHASSLYPYTVDPNNLLKDIL